MPRYAYYQLRWSEQAQRYVLTAGAEGSVQELTGELLEKIASFAFCSRAGIHYTARKQKARRGGDYWYAYRRLRERVIKRYLGKTEDLTLARLEEVARVLAAATVARETGGAADQEIALLRSGLAEPDVARLEQIWRERAVEEPLLLSRLAPPRLPAGLLHRPRLFSLLDAGREAALTLLAAPAGFGKTTLVGQWIEARRADPAFPPVAWVSLDATDNDPRRFWRYVITACQGFGVELAPVYEALLTSTPQPPFWRSELMTVLTALLNALALCPAGGMLVLEDYHLIVEQTLHESVSFFLEHLPPALHLMLITRADPPFALARLRAAHALCEIRVADLSFSQEETAALLRQMLPFPLDAPSVQQLHAQVEGWGAGLQLALLTLQKYAAPTESVAALTSLAPMIRNDASVREYFVSEVLNAQSAEVQQFLLQTSILSRLTASLCERVVEQEDSQRLLESLARQHLFLEPLVSVSVSRQPDTEQQWYRYHALFATAMRQEALHRYGAAHLRALFARASGWYEEHGYIHEAIETALDAQDYARAASLIEQSIRAHAFPGAVHEPHTLQRWITQLPDGVLEQHPALCLSYASALLFLGASWLPDEAVLRPLERLLNRAEQAFLRANQQSELGELCAFRSLLALRQGKTRMALDSARQALSWLAQERSIWRGLCLCIVAEEWIEQGHLQQARADLLEAYALCEATHNGYFQRVCMLKLAQVLFEQGESQPAASLYRQIVEYARAENTPFTLCHALLGLAAIAYEQNELEQAFRYAREALTASQDAHLLAYEVRAVLMQAQVQQARGEAFVAQQQLAALLDNIPVSMTHLVREVQLAQARLALSLGDHLSVQRWVAARQPSVSVIQAREEELLLGRWLRVQGRLPEAASLLEHVLDAARQAGQTRLVLAVQVEMVLVSDAGRRKEEALQLLRETLAQVLVSNALRLFLDAGEQMALLLYALLPRLRDQALLAYLRSVLRALPASVPNGTSLPASPLLEPLSPQEKRVLRLLAEHRSNAEIARELVVSINTVRTQVQSIYSKLGVHKRSAASDVARELRLF